MDTVVKVNLGEIDKLAEKINSFALHSDQKKSLLHDIGVEIREQTLDRFDFELDPEGNLWKKLADATVKFKNKYFDGGILEREGHLKDSLKVQVQDENSVLIGTPMHYAGFHQEGTKTITARRFLGISTDNIGGLQGVIDKWLSNHVK